MQDRVTYGPVGSSRPGRPAAWRSVIIVMRCERITLTVC